ncbi:dihydrofolate reductase [bacterium]|nr:dihydrofolate reductase [bacterium]
MYKESNVVIVVAIGENRGLGNQNKLLWHLPEDLKRFRDLTRGHPVVMGRKTFDSIVAIRGKPLPERANIVITRDKEKVAKLESVFPVSTLEEGLELARTQKGGEEIHIGGGAQIYEQALPFVDLVHLTVVEDAPEADTFFPEYEHLFVKEQSRESREENGLRYEWKTLLR